MTHQRSRGVRELNSLEQRNQRGDFYNCVITSIGPPNMSFLTTDFDFYETMTCIRDRDSFPNNLNLSPPRQLVQQ